MQRRILSSIFCLFLFAIGFAQNKQSPFYKNWFLADKELDGYYGISWQKAYDLVKGKKATPVVVALIDTGTDTTHAALQGIFWTNPKEIAGNGKDDDRNGYVDDVHGWDFIGGKDSSALEHDSYEYQRIYFSDKEKYANLFLPDNLHGDDSIRYNNWKEAEKIYQEEIEKMGAAFPESYRKAPQNYRDSVVKDNYSNIDDRYYGNNDITGGHPLHGTHIAGIIKGINSDSGSVKGNHCVIKLMIIRVVPIGDEHDKDVALAICYAVDNGARIINMSFGKPLSPEKKWVDEAVRYAEDKNVLLVHAAGNESSNNDSTDNFPNPFYKNNQTSRAKNWIEVGASGDTAIGKLRGEGGIVANFSNYGRNSVDVFAPGMVIYSSIPAPGTYGYESGTSMAAPVVSGMAAFLLSYYPVLSALELKRIIEESVQKPIDPVLKPSTKDLVPFSELCRTGGIVNLYNAVETEQQDEVFGLVNGYGKKEFDLKKLLANAKTQKQRQSFYAELIRVEKEKEETLKNYMIANPYSSSTPLAIRMAGFDNDEKQADYDKLNNSQKASNEGKQLKKELDKEAARVNSIPPDFCLPDSKGGVLQLHPMLKGKVTLIDFWASWCGPCRRDFPALKILNDRLHTRGFQVIGVSIDKDLQAWKEAIVQDRNPWRQVIDTSLAVYNLYEGEGVPRQILINKMGKIVEWDMPFDINSLETKISGLLSE